MSARCEFRVFIAGEQWRCPAASEGEITPEALAAVQSHLRETESLMAVNGAALCPTHQEFLGVTA